MGALVNLLLNPQLIILGIGCGSIVLALMVQADLLLQSSVVTTRRLFQALMVFGICCLAVFVALIQIQGITFWSVTTPANFWAALVGLAGFAWGGALFLVGGGYLYNLVGDLLPGLGYAKPPSPIGALVNLHPLIAIGVLLILWIILFRKDPDKMARRLSDMWGIKFLILMLILDIICTPLYTNQKSHINILLDAYWFIPFLPALACLPLERFEKITRFLILLSFWLRVGVFIYQIFTRPLMLAPNIAYLSATQVDEEFRLGGIAYGANNASLTLLTLMPFGLHQIWQWRKLSWLRPFVLVVLAYIIYRTDTRTTWVGFVVVILVYFILLRQWRYGLVASALIGAAFLFLPYVNAKLIENIVNSGGVMSLGNNLGNRIAIWSFAIRNALVDFQTWMIGIGWAGEPVRWPNYMGGNWRTLHDAWVSVLVHSGLLGLFAWIAFFGESIWKAAQHAMNTPEPDRQWLIAGVSSLVAFLFFMLTANADWPQPTHMVALIAANLWAFAQRSRPSASLK